MIQLEYLISKFWLELSLNELRTRLDLDNSTQHDQFIQNHCLNVIINDKKLNVEWLIQKKSWNNTKMNVKNFKSFCIC